MAEVQIIPAGSDEEGLDFSQGRLGKYRDCPSRCKSEMNQDSAPSLFGGAFHSGIAERYRSGDFATGLARIHALIPEYRLTQTDATELMAMYHRVGTDPRLQYPLERILTVESDDGEMEMDGRKLFRVPIPAKVDGKRIFLRGAMDLVILSKEHKGIEIIDWKTGFKDADPFQAEVYALAAFLKYYRATPITVRFVYTRRGFQKKYTFEAQDLPGILQYVTILATCYARETEWAPKFGMGCKDCDLTLSCGEYLARIAKIPAKPEINPEDWSSIQKWKAHLSALAGASKKFLEKVAIMEKDFLKKHATGVMEDGKEAYLAEEVSSYLYPYKSIAELLQSFGIDPLGGVSFGSGDIKALIGNALTNGKITAAQATEIEDKIEGKKTKAGTWEIEPLRTVSVTKEVVRTREVKAA